MIQRLDQLLAARRGVVESLARLGQQRAELPHAVPFLEAAITALTTVLGVAGTVLTMTATPPDRVLAIALAAVAGVFGASTGLLLRPAR